MEYASRFSFRDERQRRIYKRLELVGLGTCDYYKDICRLLVTLPPFETTTHLVGHLIREIESSLRSVLLIFDDTNESGKGDVHRTQIKGILEGLGIPSSTGIGKLWLQNAGDLAHGRAHRDNLHRPRPANDDFRQFLDQMESVFDIVLERFESNYLRVHARLDEKLRVTNPSLEDAKWLKTKIPNNHAALDYFFRQLSTPAWLKPLRAEGFFDRPPEPYFDESRNATFWQPWPLSQFLVRMAPSEPTEVYEVLLGIKTDNLLVHLDILDAAILLPPKFAVELAKSEASWCNRQDFLDHLLPDKVADLVVFLAENGFSEEAVRLTTTFLSFSNRERPELTSSERFFGPEPQLRMSHWDYGQFINKTWRALARANWKETLLFFSGLLDSYLKYKHRESLESMDSHSSIWHRAIESDEDGLPNRLVSVVRNVAAVAVEADELNLASALEILDSFRWDVFQRLSLDLLKKFTGFDNWALAKAKVLDRKNFVNRRLFHEYVTLLGTCFEVLGESDQDKVLSWIDDSAPTIEEIQAWGIRRTGTELGDREVEAIIKGEKLKWLEPLREVLPEAWKLKLIQWSAELGPAEHPGFSTAPIQVFDVVQPEKSSVLVELDSVADIVAYLESYDGSGRNESEALGRELSHLIAESPDRFLSQLDKLDALPIQFFGEVVSGIGSSWPVMSKDHWREVLRFLVAGVERQLVHWKLTNPKTNDESVFSLRIQIARLVESMLEGDADIPFELRYDIWAVIELLVEDANPTHQFEVQYGGGKMNPNALSLNTIRGKGFHSLFRYLQWCRKNLGQDATLKVIPEAKQTLEKHLNPLYEPSLAVRAVYGLWLPFLVAIDSNWVTENLGKLFPVNEAQLRLRNSVWETYLIYSKPWDAVFSLLQREYRNGVERLNGDSLYRDEDSSKALAGHLMIFYARNKTGVNDDGLLDEFYKTASDKLRAHCFWILGQGIRGDSVDDDVLGRIRALAEIRLERGESLEVRSLGWLVLTEKFEDDWCLSILERVLQVAQSCEPDHSVVEWLAKRSSARPIPVLRCMALFVDGSEDLWKINYWSDHLRASIAAALETDESALAVALINKLASRGFVDFRNMLDSPAGSPA